MTSETWKEWKDLRGSNKVSKKKKHKSNQRRRKVKEIEKAQTPHQVKNDDLLFELFITICCYYSSFC